MEEVTLIEFGQILMKRKRLILGFGLLFAVLAYLTSAFLLSPSYQATTSLYVNNGANQTADSITSINDINAAQELVSTYIEILNSNAALSEVISQANLEYSTEELKDIVFMSAKNDTEVLEIKVISANPDEAVLIANTLLSVAPDMLIRVVQAASVETIDTATIALQVGPNTEMNTMIGLLLGVIIAVLIAITDAVLDKRIKGENDLARYQLPLLAAIPNSLALQKKEEPLH